MLSSQGGPHNHTIGGLAVCLKHAQLPEFKTYQNQVLPSKIKKIRRSYVLMVESNMGTSSAGSV